MSQGNLSVLRAICFIGLISLLHCAYSAAQHRFYLRLTGQPFTQLPLDITVQTLLSLVALIYSATVIAGDFQPIRSDLQNRSKSWDTISNCPSFYTFEHRAKTCSPFYDTSRQQCCEALMVVFSKLNLNAVLYCGSVFISYPGWRTLTVRQLVLEHFAVSSSFCAVTCIPPVINLIAFEGKNHSFVVHICNAFKREMSEKPSVTTEQSLQKVTQFRPSPKNVQFRPTRNQINDALDYCLQLTRKRDYANYVGGLLMPSDIQPALFSLLAFNVELAATRDQITSNSGISQLYRLQFWNDMLDVLYGQASGPLPRQPVAIALNFCGYRFDKSLLRNLVVARQKTLGDRPFASFEDVKRYGGQTTGSLIQLIMQLLSAPECLSLPNEAVKAAESMGHAVSIITLIRSVMPLMARGIFLIPNDIMEKYQLNVEDIHANRKQDAVRAMIRELAHAANLELLRSRDCREGIDWNLQLALMASGATLDHLLRTLHKTNFNLLDTRLQRGYDLLAWRLWWRKLVCRY